MLDVLDYAERKHSAYNQDPQLLNKYSTDFGQIAKGNPLGVLQPCDYNSIINIVQAANDHNFKLTPWGRGKSQSGQALSMSGISLDISQLNEISLLREQQVKCGAGASWRDLIKQTLPSGYLPYVMPLNLDLSIGGTLSAGGFGATSFKYGPAIAHVTELEVITGAGEHVICSPNRYKDLFNAMLAGQGRCGIIVSATLKLRAYQNRTKTYYLLYNNLNQLLVDQRYLSTLPAVSYVEGFCTSIIHGLKLTSEGRQPLIHWQYGLHISFEHTITSNVDSIARETLSNLGYQDLLHEETTTTDEYLSRYDARFQRMQIMNQWSKAHPWFECFLPLDIAQKLISQFLDILPQYLGDGHRIIYFSDVKTTPLFMHSDSKHAVAFAVLPTSVEEEKLPEVLEIIEKLNTLLYENGGKRYISGWMGRIDHHHWKQHFGKHYGYWCALKKQFDPNSIFQSKLFNDDATM